MILIDEDYLPLLPWIDILANYLVYGVLEEILTSNFNLLKVVSVSVLLLPCLAKYAEKLSSDVEGVYPGNIAN